MVEIDELRAAIVRKLRMHFPQASEEKLALMVIDIREEVLAFAQKVSVAPPK